MTAIRLLLIDDNELLAQALARAFAKDPRFEWGGWLNSTEAVSDIVKKVNPTIVLMDVDMPGVDTFAVLPVIVAAHPGCKVVMFSGHIRQDFAAIAVDAGACGYLHKDEDIPTLKANLIRVAEGELVLSPSVSQALWRT